MKQKIAFLIPVLALNLFFTGGIYAQNEIDPASEDKENNEEEEEEKRHLITVAIGLTHIPTAEQDDPNNPGVFVPAIGLDYFYRFNSKWELGTMLDIETDKYFVPDVGGTGIERENVFIATIIGAYSILPGWSVFAGGGMETDKHHTLGVIRFGTDYLFKLGKNGWLLGPGFFVDFKEEYVTWSLSISVGKEFGKPLD